MPEKLLKIHTHTHTHTHTHPRHIPREVTVIKG